MNRLNSLCHSSCFSLPLLFLVVAVISGCLRANPDLYPPDEEDREITAYVTGHGWHTAVVIERELWFEEVDSLEGYPSGKYYEFGWGDRDYFMDSSPGVWTTIKAAFWPTASVVHISGFTRSPEERFPNSDVVEIRITRDGLNEMIGYIHDRLRKENEEKLDVAGSGLYGDSVFIHARGRYIMPYSSNMWIGRAVRNTGFPITPIYAVGRRNTIWQVSREGTVIQER